MASPRLLAPPCTTHPIYHCQSRIVDHQFTFGPHEKEHFLRIMRCYERLCQVNVLHYKVMHNEFHLLVEVPRSEDPPCEAELVRLINETLGYHSAQRLAQQISRWREQKNSSAIDQELKRWQAQMGDLGRFMKMLKQRFSCWYNNQQPVRRTGTLWESRYRSTLVESQATLQITPFDLDLNAVQAPPVEEQPASQCAGHFHGRNEPPVGTAV